MNCRSRGESGETAPGDDRLRRIDRRDFLRAALAAPAAATLFSARERSERARKQEAAESKISNPAAVALFLAGDVMTGRGIDQILPRPSDPILYEPYMKDARGYVDLARRKSGGFDIPAEDSYPWGFVLEELERSAPQARIVNLETSITTSPSPRPGKDIHYRMHPGNIGCLIAAGLDCCCLANNHVLDWGADGLLETLDTLADAGIATAGAGRDPEEARAPAVLEVPPRQRVLILARGSTSSGIPTDWAVTKAQPGVALLQETIDETVAEIRSQVQTHRKPGDLVVVSIHWGTNWGYRIPDRQRQLAHRLIDQAGVDLIHGHSSHHVKGIEIYNGALILYGCGDLLTDYEGIGGHERYRGDLGLLYLPRLRPDRGGLESLEMVPTQMHRMRLAQPSSRDRHWLAATLDRETGALGTGSVLEMDGRLTLRRSGQVAEG